jgi:hypothetical protein
MVGEFTWYTLDASIGLGGRQDHQDARLAVLNVNRVGWSVADVLPGIDCGEQGRGHQEEEEKNFIAN